MLAAVVWPAFAHAVGPTHNACLGAARSPGVAVCACVQGLADRGLTRHDQKRAAEIIRDPDKFHRYYVSKDPASRAFLERYRAWGEASDRYCKAGN